MDLYIHSDAKYNTNPYSPDGVERTHKMGSKLLSGLFIGYAEKAGGDWNNGDLLIIDWDQLGNAERASEVYVKRLNHKEVFPVKLGEKYRFPLQEGILRQPPAATRRSARSNTFVEDAGGDARRQSSQENPDEEQLEVLPDKDDSEDVTADPKFKDYWSIAGDYLIRHHVAPRVSLYTPNEDELPNPIRFIDVVRRTKTSGRRS